MNSLPDQAASYRWLQALIAVAIITNLSPLFLTIIGGDGSLYASIAKTMAINNDYVNLYAEGRDWLDKPHFPFWITALSFELFGIHGWAYKLPAILFLFMGARYTYLFGRKFYGKQVGLLAVLILLTAEHILLSSNDVRAEPYLTGLIVAAVYHFVCISDSNGSREMFRVTDLVLACMFTACAVMTKGIFALIPIGGAIIGHLVIKHELKNLLQPRWFLSIFLVLLFITPELYCLWMQFDNHPEKVIFGQKGVSGIRFFFWDSQFGRFFNTGPIKGKGDLSFFIHTSLWAFLPWSILMFIAVGKRFNKFRRPGLEWYSFFAAMLTFLLFSLSRFQLPHYLNIVFPFFAILTADYIFRVKLLRDVQKFFKLQIVIIALLFIGAFAIQVFYEPARWGWIFLAVSVLAVILAVPRSNNHLVRKMVTISAVGTMAINLYLFNIFYPDLLSYQAGSEAAFVANKAYPGVPIVQLKQHSYPLEFYARAHVSAIDTLSGVDTLAQPFLLFTAETTDTTLTGPGKVFPNFRISRLNGKFINKKKRLSQVQWSKLELIR
jgi:4-amino-4-deoxy-L-arabinose transferase-like glycosyltransferase